MKDEDKVHFFISQEVFDKAHQIFLKEKNEIEKIFHTADIQHVGSCAIPGALAKFDVDIQVRVTRDFFQDAKNILIKRYDSKHPELWNDEMAIFKRDKRTQIDILLTIIDSKYDDYYKVRDYLINNPGMLEKYNSLKRQFEGKSYVEYRKAKSEFLGKNGNVKFLK